MSGHSDGSATRGGAAIPLHRRLDERGIALPMAMIFMALLTMLMLAFGVLGQSEGVISSNHMLMAQARAQAESGFERAMWALTSGLGDTPPDGSLSTPLPDPMPGEYTGTTYLPNGAIGGYFVRVTAPEPANPDLREVTARGCVPNCNTPRAQRVVQARAVFQPPFPRMEVEAPCALCVRGNVGVGGTALISGQQTVLDPRCGPKKGTVSAGALNLSGTGKIYGEDGNDTPNEASDYLEYVDEDMFDGMTLGPSHLNRLREMAKARGTYFGPGYPKGGTTPVTSPSWNGSIEFSSSNKVGDGIIFVDTVSGNDIPKDHAEQNTADFANVSIHGNPFASGTFTGWIIVNGSLQISGNMQIRGTVYAVNDFTYNGTGTGRIDGLVVSQNIRDTTATSISDDSTTLGNSRINFDCEAARTPEDWIEPPRYAVQAGTYRELEEF